MLDDKGGVQVLEANGHNRETIHKATETVNDTKDRFASLVGFLTSAAGISKLVSSIRDTWGSHHRSQEEDIFDDKDDKKDK